MTYFRNLIWCSDQKSQDALIAQAIKMGLEWRPLGFRNVIGIHADNIKSNTLQTWVKTNKGSGSSFLYYGLALEVTKASYAESYDLSVEPTTKVWTVMFFNNMNSPDEIAFINKCKSYYASPKGFWNNRIGIAKTGPITAKYLGRWAQKIPVDVPPIYLEDITNLAVANGIPPAYFAATIQQESSFLPNEVSSLGDYGLCQINIQWNKDVKFTTTFPGFFPPGIGWRDPTTNMQAGMHILKPAWNAENKPGLTEEQHMFNTYAHYNGGPNWLNSTVAKKDAEMLMNVYDFLAPQFHPTIPSQTLTGWFFPTETVMSSTIKIF